MIHYAESRQNTRQYAEKMKTPQKVVLVTGGTEGVGAFISKKMSADGHLVAVTYHNEKQAVAWQDAMEKEGRLFFIYPNDVKSIAASRRLVDHIAEDIGAVDILVNAAGRGFGRAREYDRAFNITCAVMDDMLEKGFGRVVNLSFMRGREKGRADCVHALTQELSATLLKGGVTVNTVSSGENAPGADIFAAPGTVAAIVSSLVTEEAAAVSGCDIPATEKAMEVLS